MARPTAQQCHALTSHYIKEYEAVNGTKPIVNRIKAKFTMESLLMDYGPEEAREILTYYVKHYDRDLEWFNYNYEKVIVEKAEAERYAEIIAQRRRETADRLEQWKKRKQEWKKS